ncbi:MAG: hypothetical protein LAT51_08205 [Flavobacteriaceae bacterium]|nr:hypothetical protein [Flavobacteriaceae bacterium]
MKSENELSLTAFVSTSAKVMKGICANCEAQKTCVWVANQKSFCEHYN